MLHVLCLRKNKPSYCGREHGKCAACVICSVVLQVFAVCRECRPSVSSGVSGPGHHERKEGANEGVVSFQEAHRRLRLIEGLH